jgi:hypothetical protein
MKMNRFVFTFALASISAAAVLKMRQGQTMGVCIQSDGGQCQVTSSVDGSQSVTDCPACGDTNQACTVAYEGCALIRDFPGV